MKTLIVASGPAGGLLAARLLEKSNGSRTRVSVELLVRPERKRQLTSRGLYLHSPFGAFRKPVRAITRDEISCLYDLVVLCTRACEYESTLSKIAPAIGAQTIVLPIVEGLRHLTLLKPDSKLRLICGVLEARTTIDADGVLSQRPPAAELHIGALRDGDQSLVASLVQLLSGRGLKTIASTRIRAVAYERFNFMASAAATSVVIGQTLRDSRHFPHGISTFENLLAEGCAIGQRAGYAPDMTMVRMYRNAYLLEGRPVLPPAQIANEPTRASDESAFLLAEMVSLGRKTNLRMTHFEMAWRKLMEEPPLSTPILPDIASVA